MSHSFFRSIAAVLLAASAAAAAAPVTLTPGQTYGVTNVSTSTPYTTIEVIADITDIQAGDRYSSAIFTGLNGSGPNVTGLGLLDGSVSEIEDGVLLGVTGALFNTGNFSFNFGTGASSTSSLTFDDVRIVLFNGNTVVQTITIIADATQAVPEPGTLALAAGALLAAGLVRRKRN